MKSLARPEAMIASWGFLRDGMAWHLKTLRPDENTWRILPVARLRFSVLKFGVGRNVCDECLL
jgi:hypothetical protein